METCYFTDKNGLEGRLTQSRLMFYLIFAHKPCSPLRKLNYIQLISYTSVFNCDTIMYKNVHKFVYAQKTACLCIKKYTIRDRVKCEITAEFDTSFCQN